MAVRNARRKDQAAWDRVRLVLDDDECSASLSHAEVARRAGTTYEVVRAVRRDLGIVRPAPPQRRGTRRGVALTTDELRTIARSLRGMPGAMRLRVRLEAEMARREQ